MRLLRIDLEIEILVDLLNLLQVQVIFYCVILSQSILLIIR
jgi:hypothetical protein